MFFNITLQMRFSDFQHIMKNAFGTKSVGHRNVWSASGSKRLCVLFATTTCLLLIRLQIMGSRLPVFTRLVSHKSNQPDPQVAFNL